MIVDDAASQIVALTKERMSGIDHAGLRCIITEVLCNYKMDAKEESGSGYDVQDKITLYFDSMRLDGFSAKTIKNYQYHLNRFANFVHKPLSQISTQDIRSFLAMLVETRRLRNSTLETEKSILKSFFSWLEEEEYITKSPAKKIKPTKVDKRLRKSLKPEELELMRDACETTRQRCMFELLFSTGARLDELFNIDITNLNWQDESIKVIGKGNKERIVYFSDRAKLYLKRYIAERGSLDTKALFVTSRNPHLRMGHKSIQNEIKTIALNAGIVKPVYPHLLRHSFATQALKSGMSLNVIHDLLGHERMDTTLIYAQTDQETARFEYRKHNNQ